MKLCEIDECETKHYAKGFCLKHYYRWRRHGNPDTLLYAPKGKYSTCQKPGCERPHHAKGLCKNHYKTMLIDGNINLRIRARLRTRMVGAIRNEAKSGSAVNDLGCSILAFRLYIENQFEVGMSWNNYGEWHLDHVLPLASFDLSNREEFQTAAHYTNYQPLWAIDNMRKGAKYD